MMGLEMAKMILLGFSAVFTMMLLIWILHFYLKNAAIVDVGWGLGFILLALIYIAQGEGWNVRNIMLLTMIGLWGLRIMVFLIARLAKDEEEDRRYQKMRKEWKTNVGVKFFLFFEFQAVLQIVLALPFVLIALNPSPVISSWEVIGFIVWAVGLVGESRADEQLQKFKLNPNNAGRTCQEGLWYYSRHPNYFFEWMVWMGFFIFALGTPNGWIGLISPALMYYLMIEVSGVPLAEEQAILKRGEEYRQYQRTTSMFFPLPKRGAA